MVNSRTQQVAESGSELWRTIAIAFMVQCVKAGVYEKALGMLPGPVQKIVSEEIDKIYEDIDKERRSKSN